MIISIYHVVSVVEKVINKIYKVYKLEEVLDIYFNDSDSICILDKDKMQEKIDEKLKRDFLEDIDIPENEAECKYNKQIKRYQKIVNILKEKYEYKCQVCGYTFLMDNGNKYCEAHHIKMLSDNGGQGAENVIILCANHHRMFHYAANTTKIGELIDGKRKIRMGDEEFFVKFD